MKYIDEFRDGGLARELATAIAAEVRKGRSYRLMEFCGGHTHAISRYGLRDLVPDNIQFIHGPGCPVCVLPVGRIDSAIELAREHGVILCSYGDTLRVPASERMSLLRAKADGADIRMVYSSMDALQVARDNPDREVVFFAIGFETTTPPTAVALHMAQSEGLENFSVFCNHVLTPAAMEAIMMAPATADGRQVAIDGFIGPSHVSTVIGSQPYEKVAEDFRKPIVISGFEPLDVLQSVLMLIRLINHGECGVENQFTRAVTREGNRKAQEVMAKALERRDAFEWRGLGQVPHSALRIREEFAAFDAERRFDLPYRSVPDHKACECADILRGVTAPQDCKVFGTACTPDNPLGSCMVSAEGACAAHYTYGRFELGRAAPRTATEQA